MNIYHKINSLKKMLKILEKDYERQEKHFINKYENREYEFKSGTLIMDESKLQKAGAAIREMRMDLNRLVYEKGDAEVIEWFERNNKDQQ